MRAQCPLDGFSLTPSGDGPRSGDNCELIQDDCDVLHEDRVRKVWFLTNSFDPTAEVFQYLFVPFVLAQGDFEIYWLTLEVCQLTLSD